MSESEWLACTDPMPMLAFLRGLASDRKLRLFAVACCRRILHLCGDRKCFDAIETSERHADGLVPHGEVDEAWNAADSSVWAFNGVISVQTALVAVEFATRNLDAEKVVRHVASAIQAAEHERAWVPWEQVTSQGWARMRAKSATSVSSEAEAQSNLLRDVFGNPFRPIVLDGAWLTPSVDTLAQVIYDERAFDRMPHLADLLEETGCDDANILYHCRSQAEHVRGCWMIDLLLGKT
jgi:hypothetical protein